MARIKLKIGENEIEVDSRDFYVDNQTLGEVIEKISNHLSERQSMVVSETKSTTSLSETNNQDQYGLECLDDAETYEPEFSDPKPIGIHEIKGKLRILDTSKFFDLPRTVTETVQQLREFGWAASSLDVSMALAKMASNKEIMKSSSEKRIHYFTREQILPN